MTEEQFDKEVQHVLDTVKQVLLVKGKEYRRNNNPFHNFEVAANMANTTIEKSLYGFALKHLVSISDIRNDIENGKLPTLEMVDEKFIDAINYLILEKASIVDRIINKK
jgi:hypothetical protein